MAITNEKGVKAQVKKLLSHYGYFWWMPPANGYGRSGISDFHALKNSVFLAIETKFGPNKPTAMQKAFCESVTAERAYAFVVNEGNLEWLDRWLEAFDKATMAVSRGEQVSTADGAMMLNAMTMLTKGLS